MKIIHVIAGIAEAASGPSQTVPALCDVLSGQGHEVSLHVVSPGPASFSRPYSLHVHDGVNVLSRLCLSPSMRSALSAAVCTSDIVHSHGMWTMPNIYAGVSPRGARARLITSPRGVLSKVALSRSAWQKRVFWYLAQQRVARRAACFHATSEPEFEDIRRANLTAPVAIIPNGISVPALWSKRAAGDLRRLLFLGRIHPIKGVESLLRAWHDLQVRHRGWELYIVGPDSDGHLAELQTLARQLGLKRIFFAPPQYDEDKTNMFRSADLFVLPSFSENFGVAVAEALAHGVPAVVTRGAPWSGLTTNDAGWWIDNGVVSLAQCLDTAMSLPREALQDKGYRGREWVANEFSWSRVGHMMAATYSWMNDAGSPPPWVRR